MKYQTTDTRYGLLDVPEEATTVSQSLVEYGEWAQPEIDFLLHFINAGDGVVEANAHIGAHTLSFSRRVGPTGIISAFEPSAACNLLKQNMLRAKVHNVTTFRAILGAQTHPLTLQDSGRMSDQFANEELASSDTAVALNLDALGIAQCNLIRLACSGREWCALVGGRDLIERTRPYVSVQCSNVGAAWTATSILMGQGYKSWLYSWPLYNRDNFRHSKLNVFGGLRQCGLIFVPKERQEGQAIIDVTSNGFFGVESLHDLATAYGRSMLSNNKDP